MRERVESFGALHDEPAEVVELLLEVGRGGGCVVGGFGFVAHGYWTRLGDTPFSSEQA